MKRILSGLIFLPIFTLAQAENRAMVDPGDNGIRFEWGLSWEQILARARVENKYIFVDCYTTWCGPCKEMEKSVYILEKIGKYYNDRFISVKMQMDSSKLDGDAIKERYADAHAIQEQYKIEGYPSFLFFTPEGKIINRSMGSKSPGDFLSMAADAVDPAKDYYKLLERFRQGKRDLPEMSFLARTGIILGDEVNSQKVAKEYIDDLKNKPITRDNIEFMREFTKTPRDKGFQWFFQNADSIDVMMNDDTYSEQFLQVMIYQEIVVPELEKVKKVPGENPDWEGLRTVIRKKYNAYYSDRVIVATRSSWALNHKNLPEYTKYLVLYEDNYGSKSSHGLMASLGLNNYAWAVFLYSKDTDELKKALSWSSRAVMMYPSPNWMDTYANILYKLGRNKESLMWEEIALKLSPNDKSIQMNFEKMKKGEATWGNNNPVN